MICQWNTLDNEIEDFHVNSPVNTTLRQQLEDMFKDRTSRYNFLDLSKLRLVRVRIHLRISLDNNLTGDRRLAHLKDQMRQCQKVFFNLKSALTRIEKQRKIFLRRQKPSGRSLRFLSDSSSLSSSFAVPQPTTADLLLPSTCT